MSDYCDGVINMLSEDIYSGQLLIDGAFAGDCNVTIETWYSADKLMFYFQNFNLPIITHGKCEKNYLQVYDKGSIGDFQLMHGKSDNASLVEATCSYGQLGDRDSFKTILIICVATIVNGGFLFGPCFS